MRDKHIISILENTSLAGLSESELMTVRAHTEVCSSCSRAYEAAHISTLLLKERAAETFEPPPFFQTRVLAALRERQAAKEPWVLGRLWRNAGALASSMAATVATLAVLTFIMPGNQTGSAPEVSSVLNSYSAEELVLDQSNLLDDQISDDQVFTTLYGADEDAVK